MMADLREKIAKIIWKAGIDGGDFLAGQILDGLRNEGVLVEGDLGGKVWTEIRKNLTGEFEDSFKKHTDATTHEMSAAHLDECARILTRNIEENVLPLTPKAIG